MCVSAWWVGFVFIGGGLIVFAGIFAPLYVDTYIRREKERESIRGSYGGREDNRERERDKVNHSLMFKSETEQSVKLFLKVDEG